MSKYQYDIKVLSCEDIYNFNNNLINEDSLYSLDEYLKLLHKKFYQDIIINIGFELMKLINKDNSYCIIFNKTNKLFDIGNFQLKNIKKMIKKYHLIENIDYIIEKKFKKKILFINKFETSYILNPDSLKKCLIYSQLKVMNYYLFLEKGINYYLDYQSKHYRETILLKDIKIKELSNMVKDQESNIKILLEREKDYHGDIDTLLNIYDDLNNT